MTKFTALSEEYKEAIDGLQDVLRQPKNEYMRDSAIKRFELAFDLAWKTIKAFAEEKGTTCVSPLGCFQEAYQQELISYNDAWVEMVKTRNKTVHTYDEQLAEEVYAKLHATLGLFHELAENLEKNSQNQSL